MKIKTQFIITTLVFFLFLLIIAGALIFTWQRIGQTISQEQIASSLQQESNEIGYLSNDYLIYQESQQLARWDAKFGSISNDISSVRPATLEQQVLVDNLHTNLQQLQTVFTDVTSAAAESARIQGGVVDPASIRVSWSRLEVQGQGLIFNASRLFQLMRDQENGLKQNFAILIIVMALLFGAFVLTNYFLNHRRTLVSIGVLQSGAKIIGSGDLDYRIPEKGRDEISDLSRSFNQMSASLKSVTASKADLETANRGLALEIVERKKAEDSLQRYTLELETANKELEAFSYSVSHDLRTPLRTLDGFSEMVLIDYSDRLDETGRDYLNRIRKASQTMSQIIDDILKLSRVTRTEMHRERVDIGALARSIAIELKSSQPDRSAEFVIAPDIMVYGDRQLLNILLRNLLENSWKYTGKLPAARIEVGASNQGGQRAYFVRDNGIGFDMKYSGKLFQPFQRLHSSEEYPGSGIGLATVQRVVRRHGGTIWAESEIGQGSTFHFTLGE